MLLKRTTVNEMHGRSKCDSPQPTVALIAALGALEVVALGIVDELLVEAVLLMEEMVELEAEPVEEVELDEDMVEEEEEVGAVLIELMEKVMRDPSVAAASVDLWEDEVEEDETEPEEVVGDVLVVVVLLD